MVLNWQVVEGTQNEKPLELDKASSNVVIYLRRNIERVEKTDETTGEAYEVWQYEEVQLSHADYALYVAENADSKADYIAMMSDIDLEEV